MIKINIRSEYTEDKVDKLSDTHASFLIYNTRGKTLNLDLNDYSLHIATLTFLFKEMSFPNVLDDD